MQLQIASNCLPSSAVPGLFQCTRCRSYFNRFNLPLVKDRLTLRLQNYKQSLIHANIL